jgi:ABC-type phosphate transport system substrate-binding protein
MQWFQQIFLQIFLQVRVSALMRLWIVAALSLCAMQHTGFAQVVVIAHKSTPVAALENDKVLDIYTLNMKNWSDGGKITVLEVRGDSPAKARFYAALGTSFTEMQKLWLKKQFAGKGLPPTALPSEEEIAQKVASTPGAIGYVSVDKVPKDVKVLAKL